MNNNRPEAVILVSGWIAGGNVPAKYVEEGVYVDRLTLAEWVEGARDFDIALFLGSHYPEALDAFEEIESLSVTNWGY